MSTMQRCGARVQSDMFGTQNFPLFIASAVVLNLTPGLASLILLHPGWGEGATNESNENRTSTTRPVTSFSAAD